MSAAVPCLRNPFSVLSCWMLSLVAALPLKIITKPLKRWNFPFLLNGDQGESYVATCKIISSASLLSVYMQCVEVGRYLCFLEKMSQFCQDKVFGVMLLQEQLDQGHSFWFGLQQKMFHLVQFMRQKFIVPKLFFSFSQFEILLNWEKKIVMSLSTDSFQNLRHLFWSNILAN